MILKRKKYIISFTIFVMLVLMLNVVNANSIKVEQTKLSSGGAEINVHSDNKVREVRFYKKVSDKWILFYTNLESGYNDKKFFISRYKLSTSEGSQIKVLVVDEMVKNSLMLQMFPKCQGKLHQHLQVHLRHLIHHQAHHQVHQLLQ